MHKTRLAPPFTKEALLALRPTILSAAQEDADRTARRYVTARFGSAWTYCRAFEFVALYYSFRASWFVVLFNRLAVQPFELGSVGEQIAALWNYTPNPGHFLRDGVIRMPAEMPEPLRAVLLERVGADHDALAATAADALALACYQGREGEAFDGDFFGAPFFVGDAMMAQAREAALVAQRGGRRGPPAVLAPVPPLPGWESPGVLLSTEPCAVCGKLLMACGGIAEAVRHSGYKVAAHRACAPSWCPIDPSKVPPAPRPVTHYVASPGVAACGADDPNQRLTDVPEHVDCSGFLCAIGATWARVVQIVHETSPALSKALRRSTVEWDRGPRLDVVGVSVQLRPEDRDLATGPVEDTVVRALQKIESLPSTVGVLVRVRVEVGPAQPPKIDAHTSEPIPPFC